MKQFLITIFILGVVGSTILKALKVIKGDFIVVIGAWVVIGVLCLIIYFINKALNLSFNSLTNAYRSKFKKRELISKQDEDDAYQLVSDEVRNNTVNDAIWTKLYIKHKGDKKKTEIDYLKERVNQILDETESKKQQALIEQKKKKDKERSIVFGILIVAVVIILIAIST